MRAQRLFVSAAAIALVAGPGLAMAQNGSPSETPPVDAPPIVEAPPEQTPPVETPPVTVPDHGDAEATLADDVEEPKVEEPDLEELTVEEQEIDDLETEDGHGETISALARCLPSGAELHGTGFNKGSVMSQAASGGEVMLGEGDAALPVATPEDAQALCDVVQDLADQAEAPDTAKGRPDWAGPKDDDQATTSEDVQAPSSDDRGGPPAHANKGGKGRGAKANGR